MRSIKILVPAFLLLLAFTALAQTDELKVNQIGANEFGLTVAPESFKTSTLEWNMKPDTWKEAQPLKLKSSTEVVELVSPHPIVKLKNGKQKATYAAPRGILLEGAVNFRDLGGYPTKDGRQVKWGKIYRSADVSKLTDADLDVLTKLNLKMVCDLRGNKEVETSPDRLPQGTERIHLPAGSEQVGNANSYVKYMTTPDRADSLMSASYTRMDHFKAKYKPMFDQLLVLKEDNSLMFHCAAGKDRTGIGAAFILYALGVDESYIYKDYEATNEFRKGSNSEFIKMLTSQGLSEDAARKMMAADPKYLKATFDTIKKKYGSVDRFLETEMELDDLKKSQLKSKFLY